MAITTRKLWNDWHSSWSSFSSSSFQLFALICFSWFSYSFDTLFPLPFADLSLENHIEATTFSIIYPPLQTSPTLFVLSFIVPCDLIYYSFISRNFSWAAVSSSGSMSEHLYHIPPLYYITMYCFHKMYQNTGLSAYILSLCCLLFSNKIMFSTLLNVSGLTCTALMNEWIIWYAGNYNARY